MKEKLVGTALGRIALSVRDGFDLLRTAVANPEAIGTLANDQLATTLATLLCKPNHTFVDVGAHIGSVFASVIHRDPSIKVIAIEAMPDKIASLRRKFPELELHGCAAGDHDGEVSFFVNEKHSGYSSIERPLDGPALSITEIRVPIRKLDGLLSHELIDVMKIDVEGAELGVLQGAEQLIAKSRPTIMFESAPPAPGAPTTAKEAIWAWFDEHGYSVFVPNRVPHNDSGLRRDGFVESHIYPRRTTNYFAIANERRLEIRDTARRVLASSGRWSLIPGGFASRFGFSRADRA